MRTEIHGVTIELSQGDITRQPEMDAVVNAANAELRIGGGVAGAIHRAAGPELERACREHAPISPGEAVITKAFRLPNRWVVHCLGPVYGRDEPAEELLARCYRNALALADENAVVSIAFPAISTGAFGYPMEEAARVALGSVIGASEMLDSVGRVRFVLYSASALMTHQRTLKELIEDWEGVEWRS